MKIAARHRKIKRNEFGQPFAAYYIGQPRRTICGCTLVAPEPLFEIYPVIPNDNGAPHVPPAA